MRWVKKDLWKLIISITGLLLFFVLIVWIPATTAGAHQKSSGFASVAIVQTSPMMDVTATMNALQEDKLRQETQQLQYQNEQLKNQNSPDIFVGLPGLLRANAAIILSTLVIVIGGLIGLFRWLGDRSSEREKRAEERFQAVVLGLGSKDIETKVGSAIMLRTFLQRGYNKFYRQVFVLTVAHLRLRKVNSTQSEQPSAPNLSIIDVSGKPLPVEHNLSIDSLSQALIDAFKLSYPLARRQANRAKYIAVTVRPDINLQVLLLTLLKQPTKSIIEYGFRTYWVPRVLDASNIQLDDADLSWADLEDTLLSKSSLQRANLRSANLRHAHLSGANLREANLIKADLSEGILYDANLSGADLSGADLSGGLFEGANLEGANIEEARSLQDTDLRGVKGLSKEQLEACKARGAIVDEDAILDSSQSSISPSPQPRQ